MAERLDRVFRMLLFGSLAAAFTFGIWTALDTLTGRVWSETVIAARAAASVAFVFEARNQWGKRGQSDG